MAVGLLAAVALTGCGGDRSTTATTAAATVSTAAAPSSAAAGTATSSPGRPVTLADAGRCPATRPITVGPPGVSPDDFFGWGASYGNGRLWVGGLWPDGVIAAGPEFIQADGSVGMKFGWWRAVPGGLRITGRRLDGPAPPLRADVPAGYGQAGFQASGVDFPTEGCWEVTGAVGGATLTFVTFVVRR
jgi:hypothetical protein